MSDDRAPQAQDSAAASAWGALPTAAAVLVVAFTPVAYFLGAEAVRTWLLVNAALTAAVGLGMLIRPAFGCAQFLVPFIASIPFVATAAADLTGDSTTRLTTPWQLGLHVAGLVALAAGYARLSRARRRTDGARATARR